MSEKRGHFGRGHRIEDPDPTPSISVAGSTGRYLASMSGAHEKTEETAWKAGEGLERAIDAWAESARESLQRR